MSSDSGKTVINQCATKIIMKQDPSVAREVAEYFNLSSRCSELMASFQAGQGLLMSETDLVAMQTVVFDFERDYVTT